VIPRSLKLFALGLLLFAGLGCSARTVIVHDEPRLVSENEVLVVEAEDAGSGSIRVRASRHQDRVFQQDYWRQEDRSEALPLQVEPGDSRVASVGVDTSGFSENHVVLAATVLLLIVGAVVAWPWLLISALVGVSPGEDRTTVRHVESTISACPYASVHSAETGETLNLGPQPDHGWILLEGTVRLLGGPGARITIRDGRLSATFTIPTAAR
jgi:hypothetical protein